MLEFDDDDNLIPHRKQNLLTKLFFRNWVGKVPMVEETDLESIKEYFGADERWTQLEIDPSEVFDGYFAWDAHFTIPTLDFIFKIKIPEPNKGRLILERDNFGRIIHSSPAV